MYCEFSPINADILEVCYRGSTIGCSLYKIFGKDQPKQEQINSAESTQQSETLNITGITELDILASMLSVNQENNDLDPDVFDADVFNDDEAGLFI